MVALLAMSAAAAITVAGRAISCIVTSRAETQVRAARMVSPAARAGVTVPVVAPKLVLPIRLAFRATLILRDGLLCKHTMFPMVRTRRPVAATAIKGPKELPMARQQSAMTEKLKLLSQTGPDTEMGRLLRLFWQPVATSHSVKPGQAKPLRVMGEDLTLYRGDSGEAHLVAGRCAHRLTLLHTGWVQGDEIRCMYHGWKYDGAGQCTEAPAEGPASAPRVRMAAYAVYEYCGLIFAYLGEGAPPAFGLPRKEAFEQSGLIMFARIQVWPCNWFQMIENSLDAVHVSFVHLAGKVGPF